jgi:hypothetical protein
MSFQLARSEWLKFLSVFFDREEAANALYSGIHARYERTLGMVREQPPVAISAGNVTAPPLVAWLTFDDATGVVNVSTTPLRQKYTADAGGRIFEPRIKSFANLSMLRHGQSRAHRSAGIATSCEDGACSLFVHCLLPVSVFLVQCWL